MTSVEGGDDSGAAAATTAQPASPASPASQPAKFSDAWLAALGTAPPATRWRRLLHRRLLIALAVVVVAGGVAAGVAPTSSTAPRRPLSSMPAATILSKSLAAVSQQGTFSLAVSENGATERVTLATNGGQVVLRSTAGNAQLLLLGPKTYLKASPAVLLEFGIPASKSGGLADRWLVIPRSGSGYSRLAAWTSIPVESGLLRLGGVREVSHTTATVTLTGSLPRNALLPPALVGKPGTLTIGERAPYYPDALGFDAAGTSVRFVYSEWGQIPAFTAPKGARPVADLIGSSG